MNKLVVFAGPSGTGKTTIVRQLMEEMPILSFSVSATTRAPRGVELHGKDYYFLSRESFFENVASGGFIEYEEVYPGTLYGTLKSEIDRIDALGKHVIFDIDVMGALNIKRQYGNRAMITLVQPPSMEVLRQRLIKRATESTDSLEKRMGKAQKELGYVTEFDHTFINDKLDTSMNIARKLVRDFLN